MLELVMTATFKKHLRRCKKRGNNLLNLEKIIELLRKQESIPLKHKDHQLTGSLIYSRDIHIESDWILIYRILNNTLILEDTGTHSDLFKK